MRKAAKQIAVCAGILILFCVMCRLVFYREYTVYAAVNPREQEALLNGRMRMELDSPDTLHAEQPEIGDGFVRIRIRPQKAGKADILLTDGGDSGLLLPVKVDRFHTVLDLSGGGFSGDSAVLIAVSVFWLLIGAIMLWHFSRARGPAFYSYLTIYYAGFSLFSLCTGLTLTQVTLSHLLHPQTFPMYSAYRAVNGAGMRFMMLTMPLMAVFAFAMAVSNIVLLKHEHPSPRNTLGLVCALVLLAGEALGMYLSFRNFSGSEWEGRLRDTAQNVYATVFVYFECMLVGSAVCAGLAARRQPAADRDCIIILGCWFRPDGTLPPLLRDRADLAVAFWQRQKRETGREALLIPAGGQGPDEPMPEAEAIRRYLLQQGIPDHAICVEDRSRTTLENMKNAAQIIQRVCPGGKTAFSTTNYHVFRGGLWANQAGLPAEGMGSRAVWWFWPNAFMRECAGLLAYRWKPELALMALMIVFFGVLSMVL
ncbi:MAG: YdcF family protein [Clostridia bacterium]|nr:YdcF family protein [Clostridia bacterium]